VDVTDRVNLEEQLRQSQKLEAIGRLAGGVAHDFNNLLTVVTGYAEILQNRLHADDPVSVEVEHIRKAGERAVSLTRQLLAFSRRQMLQPKVLDLNEVVSEMGNLLRRLIGEDIDLITVLEPKLGRVRADPGQIEQVIVNLSVNARDAMPRGGRLLIETSNVELDEAYARGRVDLVAGRHVVISVSDTGSGMDEATASQVFEPFFTTKRNGEGTGLGLSTVYGIVKQSGGDIWVYSEPDQGTTFKIYLPRLDDLEETGGRDRRPTGPVGGSETVLLVEDEGEVRSLARKILEMNGYTVLEAENGDQALALAQRQERPIDLLVTDVVMPGINGRKLAERLTSLRGNIKVLLLSGYTDDALVREGMLDEALPFLEKPFTTLSLIRKVREVLDA
jgi:nitrogen-specific signal transduction histidine kinase